MQEHYIIDINNKRYRGITPACAGTFKDCKNRSVGCQDHPCVCRNIYPAAFSLLILSGSPLRVQEHCDVINIASAYSRITPACAGTFSINSNTYNRVQDHPCVCRNILYLAKKKLLLLGSPLRVQEHSHLRTKQEALKGITPACAGTLRFFKG